MANEHELYIEGSVRGYHAYFKDSTEYIGDILTCEVEPNNEHDRYAVLVKNKDGKGVGHVPIDLSKPFHNFLSNHGEIEAECIGSRYNEGKGKCLEVPVDYKFIGNASYLRKLLQKLNKKEESTNWKFTDVRKLG
jgi:hypothetical protein